MAFSNPKPSQRALLDVGEYQLGWIPLSRQHFFKGRPQSAAEGILFLLPVSMTLTACTNPQLVTMGHDKIYIYQKIESNVCRVFFILQLPHQSITQSQFWKKTPRYLKLLHLGKWLVPNLKESIPTFLQLRTSDSEVLILIPAALHSAVLVRAVRRAGGRALLSTRENSNIIIHHKQGNQTSAANCWG